MFGVFYNLIIKRDRTGGAGMEEGRLIDNDNDKFAIVLMIQMVECKKH